MSSRPPACGALAAARIVLFTLGKLLSILVLVAVLDACSVEALADVARSCSDCLLDIVLPTISTLQTRLFHVLYSFIRVHAPTFLHINFYHIASQFLETIEPWIPPPPIQFYILGRGIQCGLQVARRPITEAIHDLATRLVGHLVDFSWSLRNFCIDGLSSMLSSVQFWVSLFWWHSYFGLSSVLMLCSFGQSLDDQKLEPIYSINTRLAFALCSLWALFRQYIIKPWRPRSPELRQQFPDGDRTLLGYLMAHHHMSAKDASYVFSQVLDAVDHLHSKGFIHCDIKPSNILTGADLKVKLIDFGNAIELPKDWDASRGPIVYRPSNGIFGTVVVYTAREILYNSRFIPQGLDVWAMGVVLFEILTGYRPFEDQDSIMSYTINYDLDQVTGIEGLIKMWLIVRGCLDTDPFTRKTLASLRDPRGIQPFSVWKVELSKEELQMIGQSV